MDLPTFEQRRLRGDMIITFRILNFNYGNLRSILNVDTDNRLRGHKWKLKKEIFTCRTRQPFWCNRVFSTWNHLPKDIVTAPSVNIFKNRLDAFLFFN